MARYSTNMSGLPEIPQNSGFDLDSIVKIATLMNQMSESEAKFGVPGKPGKPGREAIPAQVMPEASFMSRLLGGVDKVKTLPENLPEGATFAPGASDLLTAGRPVYLKRGSPAVPEVPATPGKPGIYELNQKTELATAGLLDPENAKTMFNQYGFEGVRFTDKKTKREVFYNPYVGTVADKDQLSGVDPKEQGKYYAMDQEKALEEVGKFWRAKIAAGGQGKGDLLRLYSELNDIRPSRRTFGQKATLQALDDVLPEVLGQKAAVEYKKQFMKDNLADYKASKQNAMTAIGSINSSGLSSSEKKVRVRGILDKFKETYQEEDFYDLDRKTENSLLRGE